jgi:hypothetical protein
VKRRLHVASVSEQHERRELIRCVLFAPGEGEIVDVDPRMRRFVKQHEQPALKDGGGQRIVTDAASGSVTPPGIVIATTKTTATVTTSATWSTRFIRLSCPAVGEPRAP